MKKNQIIVIVVILFIVGALFYLNKANSEPTSAVSISGYYDANRQLIKSGMAMVGGVQGVEYITLKVNVKNTDTVPLTLSIVDASPSSFKSALGTNTLTIQPGATGFWESDLISINQFIGKTQSFTAKVKASSSSRVNVEKESSLSVKIEDDPTTASFDVTVTSSTGSSGTDLSCIEAWSCNPYGTCTNGVQTRTCTDASDCGTTSKRPSLTQSCSGSSISFEMSTNTYASIGSTSWVKYDIDANGVIDQLKYNSVSTSSCIGTKLLTYGDMTINVYSGSQGKSIIACNPTGGGYKKFSN